MADTVRESRVKKTMLNARVNLIFYFINLLLSFWSRKIFLNCLGADFLGLSSTLHNLLGFLNLAELGIGSAIGFVLYKPLFDKDNEKINEILSLFGYLYKIIGFIILGSGIILSCFLPWIFPAKVGLSYGIIYFVYYVFLCSSLLGYFFNYKQTLLGADQRNYVVTAYFQSCYIVKSLIQMYFAYTTGNYYIWAFIELIFGFIFSAILNWRIKKTYPWLQSNKKWGRKYLSKYPEIIKKTKQLFVHKISAFVQFQTTPFITYLFTSLQMVTYYTNYVMIGNQLLNFANKFLGSTEAGIGNLVAENNKSKILKVYRELFVFRYYIASIEIFSLYFLIDNFITIWLGAEYVLSDIVLVLILANIFINQTRGTNDQFIFAHGLFKDVWAPITEMSLSLGGALALGYFWKLPGVLAGSLIGLLVIVGIWKPYFLFNQGLGVSVWKYWKHLAGVLFLIVAAWIASWMLIKFVSLKTPINYIDWGLQALFITGIYSIISGILLYFFTSGGRDFANRFIRRFKKK